jgi:hypothetical protein
MGKFKMSDQVIGVNFTLTPEYNGLEGTVIGVGPFAAKHVITEQHFIADYYVSWANGKQLCCGEQNLRKRPQPGDTLQNYRDNLIPCEPLFRKQREHQWNPAPVELETTLRNMFPPTDAYLKTFDPYRLQPFDSFVEGFDP